MASPAEDRALKGIQNEILEMIAYGEPLVLVADTLCRRIEDIAPEVICSVLTVDQHGRIHSVAAPRLPDHYSAAIDGLVVGPMEGSCGRAAAIGEPVLVEDISSDPLWEKYKALALPIGLRACWSTPIKARGGKVIGTFALYYRTKRGPNALEHLAVDTCVHLCAIAIEQAEIQARVQQLAYFDTLTGLSNRSHADMLLRQRLEAPEGLGLLLIDIDNLKITNDTLGHAFGDELIRQVASRIAAAVHPGAACRIGGDEFLAILDNCQKPGALKAAAESVLASMETPFAYEGHTLSPHVTIGGALYGRDGLDSNTLRQNADLALYHSKETGRGRFVEFDDSLRVAMTRRIQKIRDLEAALSDDRIVTYYQPIVRIDSRDIVGLEALARLRNLEGNIIAASYFQEALKERRVARRLTDKILSQVAADLRSWLDLGIPFQHAGINVTTADFQGEELADRITAAFGKEGVPLSHVVLEVTETVFFGGSDSLVTESVRRLRSRGLRVALDDFGTGYASLTHLQTFPVDVIKIDKCFTERLVGDPAGEVIVAALIDIARKLGMRTVAEGVETEEQAKRLQELGCVLGQGFLFYRPASFDETTDHLLAKAQWMGAKEQETGIRSRRSVA
jgi:diguanylate cyclase (GGDEF)-like protein